MDWKSKTYSLDYLKESADYAVEMGARRIKAMELLDIACIVPRGVNWRRGNSNTRTSLDAGAIRADYLAELAYEWDKDGVTDPRDFVGSLEYEIAGSDKNQNVSEVLGTLGRP